MARGRKFLLLPSCDVVVKAGTTRPPPTPQHLPRRGSKTKKARCPSLRGSQTRLGPALTRTLPVSPFSPGALLGLAGLFFPLGLPSVTSVRESGGSAGL